MTTTLRAALSKIKLTLILLFLSFSIYGEPIQFRLVSGEKELSPGTTILVGLEVSPDQGWKVYWKNPGEVGAPLHLSWKVPAGIQEIPLEWPSPKKEVSNGFVSFGYDEPFWIVTQFIVPKDFSSTENFFELDATWVACSDEDCVPGKTTLKIEFPTSPEESLIQNALSLLPERDLSKEMTLETQGENLCLSFPASFFKGHIDKVSFFPSKRSPISLEDTPSLVLGLKKHTLFLKKQKEVDQELLEGILVLESASPRNVRSIWVDLVSEKKSPVLATPFLVEESFIWTLFLSFIGGILLNFMPCVLPVISLKIMGFVKISKESRKLTLLHGMAFSVGVVLSFVALGLLLFGLRDAGVEVGWGFQLQDATFVGLLSALLLLMSLLFFGVFEVGGKIQAKAGEWEQAVKPKDHSLYGSFWSGILATILSTPCSGPFVGTGLGLSVTLPPYLGIWIFVALGVGMALPYLLLSAEPRWLALLPKPGPWMDTFKQLMGFLLLLTVVWLVWVFVTQAGSRETFLFLFALFLVAFGSWVLGHFMTPLSKKGVRRIGGTFGIGLLAYSTFLITEAGRDASAFEPHETSCITIEGGWQTFSPTRLEELRKEGIPVFIDFTAKWCLLCQANFVVLEKPEVKERMEQLGIVKMEGDWTKNDPVITKALAQFRRNSVPLYIYYPPGKESEPLILPQVLTSSVLMDYFAVKRAKN